MTKDVNNMGKHILMALILIVKNSIAEVNLNEKSLCGSGIKGLLHHEI